MHADCVGYMTKNTETQALQVLLDLMARSVYIVTTCKYLSLGVYTTKVNIHDA